MLPLTLLFIGKALFDEHLGDGAIGYGIIYVAPIAGAAVLLVIISFFAICFRNIFKQYEYTRDYKRFKMYTAITAGGVVILYMLFLAAI